VVRLILLPGKQAAATGRKRGPHRCAGYLTNDQHDHWKVNSPIQSVKRFLTTSTRVPANALHFAAYFCGTVIITGASVIPLQSSS
jgi:hypothetical protein